MTGKSRLTPCHIASLIVTFGLIGTCPGLSTAWAGAQEQPDVTLMVQHQGMERQAPMGSPSVGSVLLEQTPRTIDEYAAVVQNRLQAAAMQMRQQGSADLRLTIERDGSIRQTEIVDLDGPAALRDEVRQLVSRITPLPALPENVDVLTVQASVAFDYPGENLLDRFGRRRQGPR